MTTFQHHTRKAFTLIELMIVLAIIAIITTFALPAYQDHIRNSRLPDAFNELNSQQYILENAYSDSGSYGTLCTSMVTATASSSAGKYFTFTCAINPDLINYTLTATGISGKALDGYSYSLSSDGTRTTLAHPKGLPPSNCWTLKGSTCDVGG